MKRSILFITVLLLSLLSQGQKQAKSIDEYPIPKNIEQCFKVLDKTMTEREIFLVKTLPEDSLYYNNEIGYETDFSFWLDERSRLIKYFNKMGLDVPESSLYPYNEMILVSYHRYLNKENVDLLKRIENYNNMRLQESRAYQQKQDSILQEYQLNKLIISSIKSYVAWNNDFVKRGISLSDTSRYYLCMDGLPADFSYKSLQHAVYFSLIDFEKSPKSFKSKLDKGISALFVNIKLQKNQFVITIADKGVKRLSKNNLGISVDDWGVFTYEYLCDKSEWILIKEDHLGI